jgi:plasmid stabilization system protein ParE
MKTYTVIISAAAEADLLAVFDYISKKSRAASWIASRPTALAFQPRPSGEPVATTFVPDCERLVSGVRRRSCSK